jgi:CheY-like chemotaxis protein
MTLADDALIVAKALVVDDQPDVLETATQVFQIMGYDVLSAASGQEAVEIMAVHPDISVLFTDVVMPGMDGYSLARLAKNILPNLVIILASGYPRDYLPKQQSSSENFSFLAKPYTMSQIARLLRQAG